MKQSTEERIVPSTGTTGTGTINQSLQLKSEYSLYRIKKMLTGKYDIREKYLFWSPVKPLLILQPFPHFTYVTALSPTLPSLYLRHSSFSNPSVALPTSQVILQPFRCFTYVAVYSPTLLSLFLRHRLFTYVTWRAAHGWNTHKYSF